MISIEGYQQEILKLMGLDCVDAIILNWLVHFSDSEKQEIVKEEDGKRFYWVKYSKVFSDILLPFDTNYKLNLCFKKMCGELNATENIPYPLQKSVVNTSRGKKVCFSIDKDIILWMKGEREMPSTLFGDDLEKLKTKLRGSERDYHKNPCNQNVLDIFNMLKKYIANDGKPIFQHKSPVDRNHYSVIFSNFQDAVLSIYDGRFLTNYKIDMMEDWFLKGYGYYLDREKIIEKIRSCKGNWENIFKLFTFAGKNYEKWFMPDSEQPNKSKLSRNINDWIYGYHSKVSMFYVCSVNVPTFAREASAEKVYNNIPSKVTKIFNPIFKKENYDGCTFWRKINQLVKWYDKNADDFCRRDSNCQYWLSSRSGFMENYLEWISDTIGKHPKIGNFGLGKTFDWYIADKVKEHGIEISIPRSTDK